MMSESNPVGFFSLDATDEITVFVGGVDKVFEIGRVFRNEGLSRKHNPEFTMLEAYQAFGDYESMMELVRGLVCHVAQKVLGTLKIIHDQKVEVLTVLNSAEIALTGIGYKYLSNIKEIEAEYFALVSPFIERFDQLRDRESGLEDYVLASEVVPILDEAINSLQSELPKLATENNSKISDIDLALSDFRKVREKMFSLTTKKIIGLNSWRRAKYKDLVREKAGADWFEISPAERRQRAHDLGAEIGKEYEDFEVTGAVFEKLIEPTLIQPTFVTHLPKELVPLAKLSPDDPTTVEVFECCINGQEIAPAYTEQNDPIEQRERLEHQAGGEQQKLDEDFLVALEHGMPPAGGMGMGIDRLCMMLLGQESIRDVILFPQLKPQSCSSLAALFRVAATKTKMLTVTGLSNGLTRWLLVA